MTLDRAAGAPAISIVTPTRNRRDVLLRAIESVRSQTLGDYEHIVVDDGSEDGTADAVRYVGDDRLRFVRFDRRRGANAARNRGIDLARSELVTFLDSDDEFLPFRLERSVALFATEPEVNLSLSSFRVCKAGNSTATVNRNARLKASTLEFVVAAQVTAIAGSAITVRRNVLARAAPFDETLWRFQDREFLLCLAGAGYGAATTEAIDWVKHYSADSISAQRGGYVAAYGELLVRHPRIRERYPDIAAYMVARRLLSNLLQGHIPELLADLRANASSPMLRFPLPRLVAGYLFGRRQRGQMLRRIGSTVAAGSVASAAATSAHAGS